MLCPRGLSASNLQSGYGRVRGPGYMGMGLVRYACAWFAISPRPNHLESGGSCHRVPGQPAAQLHRKVRRALRRVGRGEGRQEEREAAGERGGRRGEGRQEARLALQSFRFRVAGPDEQARARPSCSMSPSPSPSLSSAPSRLRTACPPCPPARAPLPEPQPSHLLLPGC